MTIIERARHLRGIIEDMAQELTDENALEAVELFQAWQPSTVYVTHERARYAGTLYECV